ncbi:unnamed protein product, partial [Closterium sp. NIES-53]
ASILLSPPSPVSSLCPVPAFAPVPQHTSVSPNGKLVVVVGDDPDAFLMDATSGRV